MGAQKRELGCAAGFPESLLQFSFPSQSVMVTFGGISFSRPVRINQALCEKQLNKRQNYLKNANLFTCNQ